MKLPVLNIDDNKLLNEVEIRKIATKYMNSKLTPMTYVMQNAMFCQKIRL